MSEEQAKQILDLLQKILWQLQQNGQLLKDIASGRQ